MRGLPNGSEFLEELNALTTEFMDVTYGAQRLLERPELLLHTLLELAIDGDDGVPRGHSHPGSSRSDLERRLFDAVGPARREEAAEVLRIGRVSWRLRDDDNLLLSRVESQLLRAVDLALERLRAAGRLRGQPRRRREAIAAIVAALKDSSARHIRAARITIRRSNNAEAVPGETAAARRPTGLTGPGQRIGPLHHFGRRHPGVSSGRGACLRCHPADYDASGPPGRRSGGKTRRMLIHGAIIAREMGIPCVNGIARAAELLADGDLVTVDGHLGIVTVGPPDLTGIELMIERPRFRGPNAHGI